VSIIYMIDFVPDWH